MHNIGITGVGGGVGQSILKALNGSDYGLIGMDGEVLGTGLYVADKAYTIPYANSPMFIDEVLKICRENDIKLLFPGLDAELIHFSKNRHRFAEIGTTVVVSDEKVIDISEDKWMTFTELTNLGFNVPATFKLAEHRENPPLSFPFIVKPYLGGARSKDVFLIKNAADYQSALEKIQDREEVFAIQEYLPGDEFTAGTVNLDGKCVGAIVMKRELRAGDTYKAQTIINPVISDYLVKVMDGIRPFGGCNVQFKLKNGLPCIFEINARCSGTTAARAISGFNEPLMICDFLLKGIQPRFNIVEKTILRYWKELEVDNDSIAEISNNGFVTNNGTRSL